MGQDPSPAHNTASQYRSMWQKKAVKGRKPGSMGLNGYRTKAAKAAKGAL